MKVSARIATVFILTLLLFTACKDTMKLSKADSSKANTYHAARYLKYVPETVFPEDDLEFTFISPVTDISEAGTVADRDIIEFEPDIDGVLKWKDDRTLIFVPDKDLKMRTHYTAVLKLSLLGGKYSEAMDHKFRFYVTGTEITGFDGDFVEQNNGNVRYEAELKFNRSIKKQYLEDSFKITMNGKRIKTNIKGEETSTKFRIITQEIEQNEQKKLFSVHINNKRIGLYKDYDLTFSFTQLNEMAVKQIIRNIDNEQPSIEIEFASELSKEQDIEGLIMIEPAMKTDIRKTGRNVFISGNFKFGQQYELTIEPGIRNKYGSVLPERNKKKIKFSDKPPRVTFSDNGTYLSSGNNKKIRFMTQNLKEVTLVLKRVYENNLVQFLQSNNMKGSENRSYWRYYGYGNREFSRVGIELEKKKLEIGEKIKNQWVMNELDLSDLIKEGDKGLYVIELSFKDSNTIYRRGPDWSRYNRNYAQLYGKTTKNIISSDLGITCITAENKNTVFVNDIDTAEPVEDAVIKLIDHQNQVMATGSTGSEGEADFGKTERKIFCISAEYKGQRSIIKTNEMKINFSRFDIAGAQNPEGKTRGFIYTDRGVFRPGDDVHLSMIFRNADNTFPKDHPVNIEIRNPLNKTVHTETLKKGIDGFYTYTFSTVPEDMTGTWYFSAEAGGEKFTKHVKIETIVPERLDVEIEPQKKIITADDGAVKISLSSKYLFGNPASGLKADMKYVIRNREKTFSRYTDFMFSNETVSFPEIKGTLFSGLLDEEGNAEAFLEPDLSVDMPSSARADISAVVLEEGGRPNRSSASADIERYKYYAGLSKPIKRYYKTGMEIELEALLLNSAGTPFAGKQMDVKVYYNDRYWWWDYGRNKKRHYRSDFDTKVFFEEVFTSSSKPHKFSFTPKYGGLYLVELTQAGGEGHSAAYFINASYWGGSDKEINQADLMSLRSDKEEYIPGETAQISFPSEKGSRVIVSVDKGLKNIKSYSFEADEGLQNLNLEITPDMAPGIYFTVSLIQPNANTGNDRPVRMIGTLPLSVKDPETVQDVKIDIADKLRPDEKFTVGIEAEPGSQFTVAVVDEGLLSITDFKSPDPWEHFFAKLRMGVSFYDLYNHVINVVKGDVMNVFSAGGGMAERAKMLSNVKASRFKPVAMFRGPVITGSDGKAQVEFKMPEYIGAVRIMVVSAKKNSYGSAEKRVPVKSELMVLPSLPRVLSPGDSFDIPVTVFAMDERVRSAEVKLKLSGPLSAQDKIKTVEFSGIENKTLNFRVNVNGEIGKAEISISAVSGDFTAQSNTEIAVRSPNPREFHSISAVAEKGSSVEFSIPEDYIDVNGSMTISKIKIPDFSKRMRYLIGYPYGCLEQTTSKAFPQLALKNFLEKYSILNEEIDSNINSAISKLRTFQKADGSFSYWPNSGTYYNSWTDIYAGHFLLEAKKKGYYVPADLWDNWKRSAHSRAIKYKVENISDWISWKDNWKKRQKYNSIRTQIYRLFVLALAGEPETGAMNLMKEINLRYLDDMEKWMLGVCYLSSGLKGTASNIFSMCGIMVNDYTEMSGSFGTDTRDRAMILYCLTEAGKEADALELFSGLGEEMNSKQWFSTQTTGFVMLSAGKFMERFPEYFESGSKMNAEVLISEGKGIQLSTNEPLLTREIGIKAGSKCSLRYKDDSDTEKVFVTLNWDGIPSSIIMSREGSGIILKRSWYTGSGEKIKPSDQSIVGKYLGYADKGPGDLARGETFRMKIEVVKSTPKELKNMALVQILPSGWEIENKRIEDENAYSKTQGSSSYGYSSRKYKYSQNIKYTDIRDDRVMWFFDMGKNVKDLVFEIDLRAVTPGRFRLPPSYCESMYSRKYYWIEPGYAVKVVK